MGFYTTPYYVDFTTPAAEPYTLDITGYASDEGNGKNWYFISSPIGEVNPEEVTNMITENVGDYDLYCFDQNGYDGDVLNEWRNYKAGQFTTLEPRKGYLYANKNTVQLAFSGEGYSGTGDVILSKTEGVRFSGWNLVGNPFPQSATIDRDCYIMEEGGQRVILSTNREIAAMNGIFVKAANDGETMTFTPGTSSGDGNKLVISIVQGGILDRAMVRFGEGNSLPKFMLDENDTKLYIPQDGSEYAVVISDNEGEMPLNFKAAANGTYTLKADASNAEMEYLHLIDNMTGTDVDLLATPSYTFEAAKTDNADRFTLVMSNTTSIDEHFAFFNGHNWTVSSQGEANLQVIDMTGRVVSNKTIDGTTQLDIDAASGVYMFRLVNGSDVKVQKVVVR